MAAAEGCEPDRDCAICSRLRDFRMQQRAAEPSWHNAPVATFAAPEDSSVRLLIVGLAPGLRGANRTGRPFTGDYAGDLLYATLARFGFCRGAYAAAPDDGLKLNDCAITNAVRCVPPANKPLPAEIGNCRPFLAATLARFDRLMAVVTLGRIAHESTVRALGARPADAAFRHGGTNDIGARRIFSSYHCSRYNTNTGRLTAAMFEVVFAAVRDYLDTGR
jgi:uracil-DNA glycosylase family 4